jgi:hypothetical protein
MKITCKLAVFLWLACAAAFPQATLTTPTPGTQLSGSTVTFDWTCSSCGATAYWLDLGTTAGGNNYYQSGNLGNVLTITVQSLPLNGTTVYATLYSLVSGVWQHGVYTYSSLNGTAGAAVMQTPTNNSTLDTNHITFTWAAGTSATAYWIDIGTTVGGNNYIQSGNLGNVLTSTQATGFPANGSTMYVTLYSLIGGQWFNNRYSYVLAPHYTLPAWTAPTGSDPAASYNIYRGYPSTGSCTGSSTPVSMTKIGSVTAPTVTYTDQVVALFYNYDYYVTAVDSAGKEGPPSNVICVVIQ